ncbi:MAG: PKD domain-containing protein [Bacteroidales bacterium]
MRSLRFICIILFIFLINHTAAQSRKAGPINTGFVFIDGKYIEPPYIIKRQGLTVKVNGKQILKMQKPESPYKLKKRPRMPGNLLNKNDGLDKIFKIKHPDYDRGFIHIIESYFLEKYQYEIACDSIKNIYKSLPNVKSVVNYNNNNDHFQIVSYNGESRIYSLSPYGRRYSHKYGPESKKHYSRKKLKSNAEGEVQAIKKKLEQNKMMFFFMDKDVNNMINSYSINEKNSHRVYDILQSDYDKNQKADSLNNIFINKEFLKRIIKEYQKTEKIKNRLGNDNNNKRKNDDDTGLIMPDNKEKSPKNQSYSPQNTEIMAWCPNPWESGFTVFNTHELPNVVDYVENQGYIYNPSNVFTDQTTCDNYFGTCTYDNLLSMRNAGLLYVASHGHQNEGIDLIYALESYAIDDWCSQNSNIQAVLLYPAENWEDDIMWGACADAEWVTQNWSSDLQQNKTLSVLSCCYSNANGWVDACTGGICFGYDEETHWGWIFDLGINYNNRNLFKRMNGENDNASKREASDAYWAMPDHKDGFTYNSNANITLCPSIAEKYPAENATVPSTVQSGYIKFDTWCDASEPADQALSFDVQNGDITIYQKSWVGSGNSNQINFQWSGSYGVVTVTVNPEYIRAYNGGQRLDYDGVTPNTDQGSYTFTVDDDIPTEAPDADFTWDTDNYTVDFADLSQNNPTSWDWDFGDGSTSTNQDPTHVYSGNGNYTVTLTVQNQYGSDNISKDISINSSVSSFEISGKVYDSDDNTVITNATVAEVDNADNAVSTNYEGEYSFYVDPGWNGSLKASASGYESYTQPFDPVYEDKEDIDFYLSELSGIYISTTNDNPNQCPDPAVKYKVEGGSSFWDYDWYLNGSQIGTQWFITIGSFIIGENNLVVDITDEEDNNFSLTKEISVTEECQEEIVASISQDCDLVNKETTVHFYEESYISPGWEEYSKRNWRIDQGGDDEIITEKKSVDEIDPYDYSCSFDHIGHKDIKLSYWECNWWDIFNNYNKHVKDAWAGVNVIDCDLTSTYSLLFPTGFTNAVRSDWAYENCGGPVYIYGGSFEFNGLANDYLSQKPTTISACNEIIINGDVEFVASGDNELVLEIKKPCNYNESKNINLANNTHEDTAANPLFQIAKCYPNPFYDKLNLFFEIETDEVLSIEIIDMNGKIYFNKIGKFKSGSHLLKISTPELQPAVYVVRVHNKEFIETFKVVKQ